MIGAKIFEGKHLKLPPLHLLSLIKQTLQAQSNANYIILHSIHMFPLFKTQQTAVYVMLRLLRKLQQTNPSDR